MPGNSGRTGAQARRSRQEAAIREYFRVPGQRRLQAAVSLGVPKQTVSRLTKGHDTVDSALKGLKERRQPGRPTTLPTHVEKALAKAIVDAGALQHTPAPAQVKAAMYMEAKTLGVTFGVRFGVVPLSLQSPDSAADWWQSYAQQEGLAQLFAPQQPQWQPQNRQAQ
jgi:hypothetical protein